MGEGVICALVLRPDKSSGLCLRLGELLPLPLQQQPPHQCTLPEGCLHVAVLNRRRNPNGPPSGPLGSHPPCRPSPGPQPPRRAPPRKTVQQRLRDPHPKPLPHVPYPLDPATPPAVLLCLLAVAAGEALREIFDKDMSQKGGGTLARISRARGEHA